MKDGGMGVKVLSSESDIKFSRSCELNAPLVAIIAIQGSDLPRQQDVQGVKSKVISEKNLLMKRFLCVTLHSML